MGWFSVDLRSDSYLLCCVTLGISGDHSQPYFFISENEKIPRKLSRGTNEVLDVNVLHTIQGSFLIGGKCTLKNLALF